MSKKYQAAVVATDGELKVVGVDEVRFPSTQEIVSDNFVPPQYIGRAHMVVSGSVDDFTDENAFMEALTGRVDELTGGDNIATLKAVLMKLGPEYKRGIPQPSLDSQLDAQSLYNQENALTGRPMYGVDLPRQGEKPDLGIQIPTRPRNTPLVTYMDRDRIRDLEPTEKKYVVPGPSGPSVLDLVGHFPPSTKDCDDSEDVVAEARRIFGGMEISYTRSPRGNLSSQQMVGFRVPQEKPEDEE